MTGAAITVRPLADADGRAGAKAATLARLRGAGFAVPDGFVVTGDADSAAIAEAADRLGEGPYAVRSSGLSEDSATASFAGQYDSRLGITRPELDAAIAQCARSGGGERALRYAASSGSHLEQQIPVLVQQLVPAEVAGVAFSHDPRDGTDHVLVEASWGLGESVVAAAVTPDRFTIAPDSPGVPADSAGSEQGRVSCLLGTKQSRLDVGWTQDDAGVAYAERTAVNLVDQQRFCLTSEQVRDLARLTWQVAETLQHPVDIEWALASDKLWLLQARPITTITAGTARTDVTDVTANAAAGVTAANAEPHRPSSLLAHGVPASAGTASGTAAITRGPADFGRVRPGDVLVCRTTDPAWTPLFSIAAAVVTETGGILSHAAIVAREFGIPAVVGVDRATVIVPAEGRIVVDGTGGSIRTDDPPPEGLR